MGTYLIQAAYTPEAWATLVDHPQDRSRPVQAMIESVGGKLDAFYFAFGDYDVVSVAELPDDITAAAMAIAVSAGGSVKSIKTTPLLTAQGALDALRRAGNVGYEPPTATPPSVTPMPAG
jgi:uncharacterized protein with GYD domain